MTTPNTIMTSQVLTASGNESTGHSVIGDSLAVIINVTAISGTSPSATFSVQWSNDAVNWVDASQPMPLRRSLASDSQINAFHAKAVSIVSHGRYQALLHPSRPQSKPQTKELDMTKFIKVTDRTGLVPQSGYHDVDDDFELPPSDKDTQFEFVAESEARFSRPALFGKPTNRKIEA